MGFVLQLKQILETGCTTVWRYSTPLSWTLRKSSDGNFYVFLTILVVKSSHLNSREGGFHSEQMPSSCLKSSLA